MEEWHAQEERKYLVGVIAFSELKDNNWWKENNTSLILTPDPVIEDIELRKLKKKSLELAGTYLNRFLILRMKKIGPLLNKEGFLFVKPLYLY